MARLLARFREEIRPQLMGEFSYDNELEVPKLDRIVINVGLGEAIENDAAVENTVRDVATISGQRPVVTLARKSVAAFNLREGQRVGVKGTIRGVRMYEFLDMQIIVVTTARTDAESLRLLELLGVPFERLEVAA